MAIDVERARAETPGCAAVVHFNNAGASLMPRPVVDAVVGHTELEARLGGYEAADAAEAAWQHTYDALARLVGADRDEIAVVENATRAWDMAFYAIDFRPGDRILTARAEYGSNYLAYLQVARRTGAVVEVVPDDEHGQLDVAALERMLDERVRLVSVTHVPTNGGLVNPAREIGRVLRGSGILYLLDACQSAGQIPLDVGEIGCDLLTVTGRKFLRAPRGTGFLYARREVAEALEPPFVDVRAATWEAVDRYSLAPGARRFENWETSYATKVALGVAADYALALGLEAIEARNRTLASRLRDGLDALEGARTHDLGAERCAIVSFSVDGMAPDDVRAALARDHVNVSVSQIADTRLDFERRDLDSWVRASVHYFNTEAEVDLVLGAVEALAAHRPVRNGLAHHA